MDVRQQRDRFMAFAFAGADLLVETRSDGAIGYAVGAASALGAARAEDLVGQTLFEHLSQTDRTLVARVLDRISTGQRAGPLNVRTKDNRPATLHIGGFPSPDNARFVTLTFATPANLAAAAAPRDAQTGLVAPEAFETLANDALASLQAEGKDAAVTFLNVDGQDALTAKLDEQSSSAFLNQIGAVLRAAAVGDAVSQVADGRYSLIHDEGFDAAAVEDEIAALSRTADPEGKGVTVNRETVAVDATMSPQDMTRALVYAVNAFADGDDSIDMTNLSGVLDGMMKDARGRMAEFKSAIADRRVRFVAQPITELKTRRVSHYELLVRFDGDESPFEMVAFAEKTGIIADLDMAVFEVASEFIAERAPKGFAGLAVNVSGLSIVKPAFTDDLMEKLQACKFARSKLAFEITESAEIADLEAADQAIKRIRALGHNVYLDDFGAGAASFPYLRALDVDGVKIDGAYVRSALKNPRDAMLLKAMAGLCADLGVTTIAEMVETNQHLDHLRKLGIEKGQGWLFGKPKPLEQLASPGAKKAA